MTAIDLLTALLDAGSALAQYAQDAADDSVQASGDETDREYPESLVAAWEAAYPAAEQALARECCGPQEASVLDSVH